MDRLHHQERPDIAAHRLFAGAPSLTVESDSFSGEGPIPAEHAGGHGRSPALRWSKPPPGTRELIVLCEDPDAPTAEPFVHWIVTGLPPNETELPEGQPPTASPLASGVIQGRNDMGTVGYYGPQPPPGHGVHHYHFQVFAADRHLPLRVPLGRGQLIEALRGHVRGWGEVVGTYER
jgi:Raf kinase inhibitor-like YbhB/YbcL family protein